MKQLKQNPGEKPLRTGTWREQPLPKDEVNTCIIEPGDERMPPTRHKGSWWIWTSFETYRK